MTRLFRAIEMPSDEPVQYVGVYVLRWGTQQHPDVGFIPMQIDTDNAAWKIVQSIIQDLSDRQGLGDEWNRIDNDIRYEIKREWERLARHIVEESLNDE